MKKLKDYFNMKDSRKYGDAATGAFIGWVGITLTTIVILLITYVPGCSEFNKKVSEGIKNDPRPANHISNYLPPSFYLELDTLNNNLDSLEKHLDSLIKIEKVVDSILLPQYSDEHVMWVGGNGDTIWE
jgi:hypothetical protein